MTQDKICVAKNCRGLPVLDYELRRKPSAVRVILRKNTGLPPDLKKGILWQMKLRTDLLEQLTGGRTC